jgi:hypothetical protein
MNNYRTRAEGEYPEKVSLTLIAEITDENGVLLVSGQLTTLTLTIYAPDILGSPIINNKKDINILNANGGVFDSDGIITVLLSPQDTVCVGSAGNELHRHLFTWTFSNGSKTGRHEVDILFKNMYKVG